MSAVDVNRLALGVYRHNLPHPVVARSIESLGRAQLQRWGADLWWLSPPCQPYTRRGHRRDLDDPRAHSFLAALAHIEALRPTHLALENVPGFGGSRAHGRLRAVLDGAGYRVWETLLCPTELGIPNRRRRFYLVASQLPLQPPPAPRGATPRVPLARYLDAVPDPTLWLDPDLVRRYHGALHVVDLDDPAAVTSCFTAAYGRSPVRSGGYLQVGPGLRRFSPREMLRLMGFGAPYDMPPGLARSRAWRLVGNSVSVPAVRWVLAAIPELGMSAP